MTEGTNMPVVSIKMRPELKEELERAADAAGLPMNRWIVELIANRVGKPELARVPRKRMGRPNKQAVA
jgi:hypothetical protein